jgi:hypothetical protein
MVVLAATNVTAIECGNDWVGLGVEIWRYGDMEIWRYGDMEIWRYGDMEMEIWRY